jgi:integrase
LRTSKKLSALEVARLTEPGRYADGVGLYLQVSPGGSKQWLFRYMRNGQARHMGLGPLHTVTLADAREQALKARRLLLDGVDPIEARRAGRMNVAIDAARGVTFSECSDRYFAAHQAGWRSAAHREQWKNSIANYALPVIGALSIAAIDTALVLKVLEPIWNTKSETASRVRGRIESVIDWGKARGYRQGENPARWRGHLDKLLPSRNKVARVEHHAALPYVDLPAFMASLRARDGTNERALEFTILTAARTGEVLGARWAEIDLASATWTVPAGRMKALREHRVPLSKRAVEILESLPREGEYVFPGARGGPLSSMALFMTLRRLERGDLTTHGFRSTFRDWAAETTAYPTELCEIVLAHAVGSQVEAAYRRGDMFDKRRRLMADWATYCAAPTVSRAIVVPIRG